MLGLTRDFREVMAYFARRSLNVSLMDAPSRSWWDWGAKMLRTLLTLVFSAGLVAAFAPRGAEAAMPVSPAAVVLAGQDNVERVTFWSQPYPYRYSGWQRCRRVRVETSYGGWYWERICDYPGVPVLRRAY